MKKAFLLLLSMSLFLGLTLSLHALGRVFMERGEADIPPNLEEIHLDILIGHKPTKPRSPITPPVSIWYSIEDRSLIIKPQQQAGWLTVNVEDEAGVLLVSQVVDGNAGHTTIDLMSLQDDYYMLTIQVEAIEPILLTGWFEVH